MRFIILITLLIISSCNYQKDNLESIDARFDSLESNYAFFLNRYVKKPNGEAHTSNINLQSFTGYNLKVCSEIFVFEESDRKNQNIFYDSRVDYKKLLEDKNTSTYQNLRNSILAHIAHPGHILGTSKSYQTAFYINAYNFLAIDLVIQNSNSTLIESISDLGGIGSFEAFSNSADFGHIVAGENLSLDQIEKTKLVNVTGGIDARLHFAVICASGGCPILLHVPYTEGQIESQLNFITKAGLKLRRMIGNDTIENDLYISSIFDWYLEDFKRDVNNSEIFDDKEFIKVFIKRFTPTRTGELDHINGINYSDYDWKLNILNPAKEITEVCE